jgi:hypothetical protein
MTFLHAIQLLKSIISTVFHKKECPTLRHLVLRREKSYFANKKTQPDSNKKFSEMLAYLIDNIFRVWKMCKQIFAIYMGPSTHVASGAETGYPFGPPVFTRCLLDFVCSIVSLFSVKSYCRQLFAILLSVLRLRLLLATFYKLFLSSI